MYLLKAAPGQVEALKVFDGLLADGSLTVSARLLCNFGVYTPQEVLQPEECCHKVITIAQYLLRKLELLAVDPQVRET